MKLLFLLLLGCFPFVHSSTAQTEHTFTSGLIITDCHRYGREAIVTDQIAYQLYTGQLKKPEENTKVFTNDQGVDVSWKPIAVDSTGKFRGNALMNGYLYLTYNSQRAQRAILNISGNG